MPCWHAVLRAGSRHMSTVHSCWQFVSLTSANIDTRSLAQAITRSRRVPGRNRTKACGSIFPTILQTVTAMLSETYPKTMHGHKK
jgi:hypothetical protein